MSTLYYFVIFLVLGIVASCGRNNFPHRTPPESKTENRSFIPWAVSSNCILQDATKRSLKVCIQGTGNHEQAKERTQKALKQWLDAIRPLDSQVTSRVEFSCENPQATVNVNWGAGQEYATGRSVYVYDASPLGTYLHEFGHAFACLGDTYSGGTAGYCIAGQPHSVMCDGLLVNELSEDDLQGVQQQFRAAFPSQSGAQRPSNGP